jgi:PAS domain S-box-containing protein
MKDSFNEELQALTQLASYQLAINILPFDKKYSEFIHYGLNQVVRTSKCRVCLYFTQEPVGDTISDSCKKCDFYKCSNDEQKCNCLLFNDKDIVVIPIQKVRKSFGYIALNNSQRIKPSILASIRNFANAIAVSIENKLKKDLLDAQNKELFQFNTQIINSLEEGVIVYDHNLRYKLWNHFMEELSGIPATQVLGKYPTEVFPFLEETGVIKNLNRVLKGENVDAVDFPFHMPLSGKSGWSSDKNVPLRNVNGEINGVIGTVHDITERKLTEKALHESEKLFHSLFDNMCEGVALHELEFLDGKPYDYRIIDTNARFNEILGIIPEQVVGKLSTEAYKIDTPPYFDEYVDVTINKNTLFFETYYASMNKHFSISAAPWQENGFVTIFIDITERKQIELNLKENETKLHQLNVDKNRFISILGHDLKNPLNNLYGLSEILIEDIHTLEIGAIETMATKIHAMAQNTNDLLDDILVWARMQSNGNKINPQLADFRNICAEVLKTLTPFAKEKNITIHYSKQGETMIFADVYMIKTIIRNLVSNAIKFTNPNGKIIIAAEENNENVIIAVSDNGMGMEPERLAKLFDISEVHSTKGTANEKGTGLGLVLCKEFVEKHGGKIWVKSEVGKGSDFKFTMPLSVKR